MRAPEYIRDAYVNFVNWAKTRITNVNLDVNQPYFGDYVQEKFIDVSALVAGTAIEFIEGVEPAGAADGTSLFSLADVVQKGNILAIFGMFVQYPDVSTDRADEDENQAAKAIIGDGLLRLTVGNNARVEEMALASLSGQAGYRTGAGAGSEFARESPNPGRQVTYFPTPFIALESTNVSLSLLADNAALTTNALDFTMRAGIVCALAGPGLTGGRASS